MDNEAIFGPHDLRAMNFFSMEAGHFERDVHVLILGTLHAGTTYLSTEADNGDLILQELLKDAEGDVAESIVEKQVKSWSEIYDQENFPLSTALVASLKRTHRDALHEMARSAESFAPRNPKGYGERRDDEFKKTWAEYSASDSGLTLTLNISSSSSPCKMP